MDRMRTAGTLLCLALAGTVPLAPQGPGGGPRTVTVRGTVVAAESGQPLPFSIVALVPVAPQAFTSPAGEFSFPRVPPGRYRLLARQIGYTPWDTMLVVGSSPDTALVLRVALLHVAIELPAITASATGCVSPGAPDATAAPELAAVFGQVLENARRFALLANAYPYRSRVERTFSSVDPDGGRRVGSADTIEERSREDRRYRPGDVVFWGTGEFAGQQLMRLPELRDFDDSAFVTAHCFALEGRDTLNGGTFVRLDFTPAATVRTADVDGAAYLDSATYQIRYTVVRLTHASRAIRGVDSLVSTSRFREVVPGIVVRDWVRALTTPTSRYVPRRLEEQRLLTVSFSRPLSGP
jgi:carboxypeptidase family protein